MSDESIKPPSTSDNSLAPSLSYIGTRKRVKFVGSCLKQDKITFTHGRTVNIYIVYEINLWDCGYGYDDYPDYANYKCRKRIIDKLLEECSEDINENINDSQCDSKLS